MQSSISRNLPLLSQQSPGITQHHGLITQQEHLDNVDNYYNEVIWIIRHFGRDTKLIISACFTTQNLSLVMVPFLHYLHCTLKQLYISGISDIIARHLNGQENNPAGEALEEMGAVYVLTQHGSQPTCGDNLLDLFITGMSVNTIQIPVRLSDYAVVVIIRREPLSKRSGAVARLIENNSSTSTPVRVGSLLSPQIPTSPLWVSPIAYLQAQLHSLKNIRLQAI